MYYYLVHLVLLYYYYVVRTSPNLLVPSRVGGFSHLCVSVTALVAAWLGPLNLCSCAFEAPTTKLECPPSGQLAHCTTHSLAHCLHLRVVSEFTMRRSKEGTNGGKSDPPGQVLIYNAVAQPLQALLGCTSGIIPPNSSTILPFQ